MKIAIIGAGPTGLTIANELTKNKIEVDIYDNSNQVGGFAKSIKLWERNIEIGPHFLNVNRFPIVKEMVLDVLDGNFKTYERKTYILTINKLFLYPPSIGNILKNLNLIQLSKAGTSLIKQLLKPIKLDGTAENFVKRILGDYLYTYFFGNFSKKLWGVDGSQLSEVFATSLIGFDYQASLIDIVWRLVKKSSGRKQTDDALYVYPNGGLSTLWDALKNKIQLQGGTFHLSTAIESLTCAEDPSKLSNIVLKDGSVKEYDLFVSTIPILALFPYIKTATGEMLRPNANIRFQSDVLLYLQVTFDKIVPGQCFYIYSEDIRITRITNFDEFDSSNADAPFTILLLEFWGGQQTDIWNAEKEELVAIAMAELNKTKIFSGLKITDAIVKKVGNAFQIPDLDLIKNQSEILGQLSVYDNLIITGRNASLSFNYGMENGINDGLQMAAEILTKVNNQEYSL
ncbi:protoporphyrinogen/coproporphyrinogen oxidase [Mucilaginibacter agri]|uniref:NAD(P)-binding protein n=1 Tax=Mucilaginibacter agri TaxID=2695265 RepID=A0A965ZKJ0_9SPHI|nr:FAD-dependent oxidoreductase [Mucilaginibacter agri]NCD72380.1 NAD(P)-binding protein [Mucilaginibacter agri]